MISIQNNTIPCKFILNRNVRDGHNNVDITIDAKPIIGFYVDNDENIVLKTWGDNCLYQKYNMSYHHMNQFDRLIIIGFDDI